MNESEINAMWDLVANHTAAELAKMVVSERARRRDNQRFADVVVSQRDAVSEALAAARRDRTAFGEEMVRQRDAAVVARDAARRDRAALLEARGLQNAPTGAQGGEVMSRSELGAANVRLAVRGRRGQAALRDAIAALDAMPVKALDAGTLALVGRALGEQPTNAPTGAQEVKS